jgi:hypothetical protein
VMSFTFHIPQIVPLTIVGGAFDSSALANSLPQGFGTAGVMPVPAASSAGILVPREVPQLGTPVPPEVHKAFTSFDYTNTPNYCQAVFPPSRKGLDEAHCGGPAQEDPALGFTSATMNGHVIATGDFDDPLKTRTVAESRGEDATVPGLQARFRNASSQAVVALNDDGIPQSQARAEATAVELLGGMVKLSNVTSESTVVNDGTEQGATGATAFNVGSTSILGVPVRLSPEGFTVIDPAAPAVDAKALTDAVNKAANVSGFSMRMFPASPVKVDQGVVTAESGGVEISYGVDKPTPARVVQRYGYTVASLSALAGDPLTVDTEAGSFAEDGPSGGGDGSSGGTPDAAATAWPGTSDQATIGTVPLNGPAPPVADMWSPQAGSADFALGGDFETAAPAPGDGSTTDVGSTQAAGPPGEHQPQLTETRLIATLDPGRLRGVYLALAVLLFGAPLVLRLRSSGAR